MKPSPHSLLGKLLAEASRIGHTTGLANAAAAIQKALGLGPDAKGPASPTSPPASPPPPAAPAAPAATPTAAAFHAGSFDTEAGTRAYKLFVPAGFAGQRLPLIVMLHGCTQDPDDFAAGTRMNTLAAAQGAIVLYPAQPPRSNSAKCWNWFQPADQHRGGGEPALLAAMTADVIATQAVDPDRVYAAGLSAGGAMAAILGREYPDLFAAIGVHSGLPAGAADNVMTAFAAMQKGASGPDPAPPRTPIIVFHGDSDATVHPANGDLLVAALNTSASTPTITEAAGRQVTHRSFRDSNGAIRAEHWLIHGAGHAWSGGSASGSYSDETGPDASREMLRFFLAHPRPSVL